MTFNPFVNARGKLRNGWWIAIFFVILTALLFPLILLARNEGGGVPISYQLGVLLVASLIAQALRRRPIAELFGKPDVRWGSDLLVGLAAGALLMALPAAALGAAGAITWRLNPDWADALGPTLLVLAMAAATEEVLFRGFLFQRLIDGLGAWPAQLIVAGLFVLTHSAALEGQGALGWLAGANIFLASIMFGLAYLRTRSLALPIGLHFAANATQGPLLGFGVSGSEQDGILVAIDHAPDWISGGAFGIEASLPGLIAVIALTYVLWRRKSAESKMPVGL